MRAGLAGILSSPRVAKLDNILAGNLVDTLARALTGLFLPLCLVSSLVGMLGARDFD